MGLRVTFTEFATNNVEVYKLSSPNIAPFQTKTVSDAVRKNEQWRYQLKPGMKLDACDTVKKWYTADILEVREPTAEALEKAEREAQDQKKQTAPEEPAAAPSPSFTQDLDSLASASRPRSNSDPESSSATVPRPKKQRNLHLDLASAGISSAPPGIIREVCRLCLFSAQLLAFTRLNSGPWPQHQGNLCKSQLQWLEQLL